MSAADVCTIIWYLIMMVPTIHIMDRHGKYGIIGWIYLVVFYFMRWIGASMQVYASKHGEISVSGAIVSTTALGAYVLAVAGILHQGSVLSIPLLHMQLTFGTLH